jgi:hypothetical protein
LRGVGREDEGEDERMEGTMEGGGGGEGDGRGDGSEIQGRQQALTNTRTVGEG